MRDKFNFHVPDEIWDAVVPYQFKNRVVCLSCFDRLAADKCISYADTLKLLYFAGDKAVLELAVVSSVDV